MRLQQEKKKEHSLTIVEFCVGAKKGDLHYGINIAKTKEIVQIPQSLSEFPRSHPAIMGVAPVRGTSCLFIDLAKWMGVTTPHTTKGKAIVTTFHNTHCGFCVSSIVRTIKVPWADVKPPDAIMSNQAEGFVTGVLETNNSIISLLDFEGIMANISASTGTPKNSEFIVPRDRSAATLFVIEDSRFTRRQIIDLLSRAGYRVFSVGNGKEALEKLTWVANEAVSKNIDIKRYLNLIITDIELPIISGEELIPKIGKIKALHDIPILIFSSMTNKETTDKWLALGAATVVPKPDTTALIERIDEMVFGAIPPSF
ncbi:hypothetical protein MNBD_NITROSPINAE01-1153 [hydrothermal vent metagenome]|uniref:Chemotaxis protein CheV n=1 Tax=hydrothermal vent metagenome TaxID=652676 RepID=A0A3B1CH99_9ZZZZ